MEGVVKQVDEDTGIFIVETDDGFTVFEVDDADCVQPSDVLSGALDSESCDRVVNHSRDG